MSFEGVPNHMKDTNDWVRRVARVVNSLLLGKSNNVHSVTLTANASSTTVTLAAGLLGKDTVVLFTPVTSNAAAEIGNGTMYQASRDVLNNQFTISHANNAQTDRTFSYVLIG